MLASLTKQLSHSAALTDPQVQAAVEALVDPNLSAEVKADFLSALATKGETPEEIAAFARLLRDKSVKPPIDESLHSKGILDVVGTGGDRLNTFNISTTAALVAAAAGITVAKHGNRAITSQSGSADVLEALGIRVDLSPKQAAAMLKSQGFAFFFAPLYHPAFKQIGPARKICAERGQRTLFNFLGPLLNPVRPTAQLMGVVHPDFCEPLARVLQSLGMRQGMVVCGGVPRPESPEPAYLDELSTLGDTRIAEFYHERGFHSSSLSPESFPLQPGSLDALTGGDRQTNASIVRRIFSGEERGPKRDAVLLNAGAALLVGGVASSLSEGWERAAELIDDGQASTKLEAIVQACRALST